MSTRLATPGDAAAIAAIGVAAFGGDVAESSAYWRLHLGLPGARTVVAPAAGPIVGFASVVEREDGWVELGTLAVDAAHRRLGIGSELLVVALAGAGDARANVSADNIGALAFYARHGFVAEVDDGRAELTLVRRSG